MNFRVKQAGATGQGACRLGLWPLAMVLMTTGGGCAAPARTGLWSRFAPPQAAVMRSYTVRRGDTPDSVARHFDVSTQALRQTNGLGRFAKLRPGATLHVPESAHAMRAKSAEARRVAQIGPTGFSNGLRWPVRGVLTSPFGKRWGRVHDGIDIGAPKGSGVVAAADGEVVFSDNHGAYGNVVIVRHGGGMMTVYAHAERNLVRQGDRVRAGQLIARVGNTGRSTGPHLHFEVRRGVQPENPMHFLPR